MESDKTTAATAVAPSAVLLREFGVGSRRTVEAAESNKTAVKPVAVRRRTTWPQK